MLILVNRKQNDPITILSMQSVKYFFPGVYFKNGGFNYLFALGVKNLKSYFPSSLGG